LIPPRSAGGAWTHRALHNFSGGTDGAEPSGPLAIDSQGVIYGTTSYGGGSNLGSVFSLTPPASPAGAWTEAVIYSFTGRNDGASPAGGVLIGAGPEGQTVLYGTALRGPSAGGIVYSLTPPSATGTSWTQTELCAFDTLYGFSTGPLAWSSNGVLYGSAFRGGDQNAGSVYALAPPATVGLPWTFASLYSFTLGFAASGGNYPYQGETLAVGRDGLIYGTTFGGGPFNEGTVFALRP
jgi:uncharacterized repeat protein (TIGR03803 family)